MSFLKRLHAAANTWPYFHKTNFKDIPHVRTQSEMGSAPSHSDGFDPEAIYFFIKGMESSSSVYETDRKHTWEAKLTPKARVLTLNSVTWDKAWQWLKEVGVKNQQDFLDVLYTCHSQTFNAFMDTLNVDGDDKNEVQKAFLKHLNDVHWSWFRVLRKKIYDSKKFANFFIRHGYNALLDDGPYLYGDEPQLVVLDSTAVEMRLIDGSV